MPSADRSPSEDPLFRWPFPRRPVYETGVLLDAADFRDEQTYHRNALARALWGVTGSGTLAGLRVTHGPSTSGEEQIRVEAGLAVDRLGRLVELRRQVCLRLDNWWASTRGDDGGDALTTSAYPDVDRFVSPRTTTEAGTGDRPALPARAVIADVYLRFVPCADGYTPSFRRGPYDALNAITISRIQDGFELSLIPRPGLDDDFDGLPVAGRDLSEIDDPEARRAALQDRVLDGWEGGGCDPETPSDPPPLPEHAVGVDPTSLLLARVLVPVTAGDPPDRDGSAVVVDNWSRRFVSSTRLMQDWLGI